MDPRALEVLAWLDEHAADVNAHKGAAYAETCILRALVMGGFGASNVLSEAYAQDLGRRVMPMEGRAEARGFAHAVMFATDFGGVPVTAASGTLTALDAALITHADDTDTLGELLIAAACLQHVSPHVQAARNVFDLAWEQAPRSDFAQHYHVILVGGLLYAMTGQVDAYSEFRLHRG